MSEFVLTEQQREAVETAHRGGHTLIAGGPGGGKTEIQSKIYRQLEHSVKASTEVLAYNTHSRDAIRRKLGDNKNFRTFDSLAWVLMARHLNTNYKTWKPDRFRHRRFINLFASQYWSDANGQYAPDQLQATDDLERIQTIAMATLFHKFTDKVAVASLAEAWEIELTLPDFVYEGLPKVMKWTISGLDEPMDGSYHTLRDSFAFDDLSYCVATNPNVVVPEMKCVMPDELQDATVAQWVMLRRRIGGKAYSPGEPVYNKLHGQLIGAGDQNQSVYMFRGVVPDMWGRIVAATQAQLCPLTVSFRLAKALLPRPKAIVPALEVHPGNCEGAEIEIDMGDVITLAQPGHVGLFLTNAQAIRMAYFLIRNGVPAVVRGTEIGVDLVKLLDLLAKVKGFVFAELSATLDDWVADQVRFMMARYRNPDQKIEAMRERAASLEYLWEGAWSEGIRTVGEMRERIGQLFADNADAHGKAFVCMTYHKSKGLEWPVVYMEEVDLCTSRDGIPGQRQHRNVLYVGLTRPQLIRYIIRDSRIIRNKDRML